MDEWQEDILIKTSAKERDTFSWDQADVLV